MGRKSTKDLAVCAGFTKQEERVWETWTRKWERGTAVCWRASGREELEIEVTEFTTEVQVFINRNQQGEYRFYKSPGRAFYAIEMLVRNAGFEF